MLGVNKKHGLVRLLYRYSPSDKVVINLDGSQVKGLPHRRFNGLVGTVLEVGRRVLKVEVPVGNKKKIVIARKEHIVPLGKVNA